MRERNQILTLWQELKKAGQPAVLATVVRTEGSSYRLPGARLLLARDGRRAGGVSGGCLEADLVQKAWWLTENGPTVRKYDTTPEGESFGLGCNGIISVLLERVTPEHPGVLPLLETVARERRPITIKHQDLFEEVLTPPIHLLIFGAGDDAVALSDLAKYLGWQVSIFDGRAQFARPERFPSADHVSVRAAGSPLSPADPWTVAVVMTHSYVQDLDIIRSFAAAPPLPYLGVLGPRKRTEQLLAEAAFPQFEGTKPHTPLGLDLGGHGAEQVAIAAIAEIQAVLNGRSGGFLSDRPTPIHSETSPITV
ncbi:MAG TPA: XdhC family protein [Bryobacteraceae bacterium]|jgi:xanthine/CO dehydrogenase XdhC/CoxF family maturation factor